MSSELRKLSFSGAWDRALPLLQANPEWMHAKGDSGYSIVHQLAYHGADAAVVNAVAEIDRAGFAEECRAKSRADGTPVDIARAKGHALTAAALEAACEPPTGTDSGAGSSSSSAASSSSSAASSSSSAAGSSSSAASSSSSEGASSATVSAADRISAALHFAAVGDAVGYNNGAFEFNNDASWIESQMRKAGGPAAIDLKGWRVSDDTIQHLATLQAVIDCASKLPAHSPTDSKATAKDRARFDAVMTAMAAHHVSSWKAMGGRAPGNTCRRGVQLLKAAGATWQTAVPFSSQKNCGCGSAMRAMGLGAVFSSEADTPLLVALAAESAALSHHSVAGCAAAVVAAAGCALASRGVPHALWPRHILDTYMPQLRQYLTTRPAGRAVSEEVVDALLPRFTAQWELAAAGAKGAVLSAEEALDADTRDAKFAGLGHGWDGTSAVFIAWDALQAAQGDWDRFLLVSAAHGGDSDSTATIGGAWLGAMSGMSRAPAAQMAAVEFAPRIQDMAEALTRIAAAREAPEATSATAAAAGLSA